MGEEANSEKESRYKGLGQGSEEPQNLRVEQKIEEDHPERECPGGWGRSVRAEADAAQKKATGDHVSYNWIYVK